MAGVLQNGSVSPGHSTIWVANGVIGDGGPFPAGPRVLGASYGTSFSTTSDQPILLPSTISAVTITGIIVTNASASLNTAQGGVYPAPGQTGSPLVAATQVYSTLLNNSYLLNLTLTAFATTTRFTTNSLTPIGTQMALYFSLTTAQSGNPTADVYVLGVDLSP